MNNNRRGSESGTRVSKEPKQGWRRQQSNNHTYYMILAALAFATADSACTFNISLSDGSLSSNGSNLDQTLTNDSDNLIHAGRLAEARKLLEDAEDQRGLTQELSDKLDGVYIAMARQKISQGEREEAKTLLQFIPPDAKHYKTARELLNSFSIKNSR